MDAKTDEPLPGVPVQLQPPAGAPPVDTEFTDAQGRFELRAPEVGWYRLLALSVDHRPLTGGYFGVPETGISDRRVPMEPYDLALDGVEEEDDDACHWVDDEEAWPAATRRVQAAVRAALATVLLSEELGGRRVVFREVARKLDPELAPVEVVHDSVGTAPELPAESPPPEILSEVGYVQEEVGGGVTFFLPDAETLLSEAFWWDHCFRVVRPDPPELPPAEPARGAGATGKAGREEPGPEQGASGPWVGLAFETESDVPVPEIHGTFLLDPTGGGLRRVEFRYVGVDLGAGEEQAGGSLDLLRLPDGRRLVAGWRLRTPIVVWEGGRRRARPRLEGFHEAGARVQCVLDADGCLLHRAPDAEGVAGCGGGPAGEVAPPVADTAAAALDTVPAPGETRAPPPDTTATPDAVPAPPDSSAAAASGRPRNHSPRS